MKIVFMGTPEHAAKILADLIESKHEILCVITQPDRPRGRGLKISAPPVKELAQKQGLRVEQPEKAKDGSLAQLLKELKPEIVVVVAYGKILPKEVLDIPKYGCVNIHASLLPKYRGAAPVQWALLNGEKETGVTLMNMNELLDAGEIILQKKIKIQDEDNAVALSKKLFDLGGRLLLDGLEQISKGTSRFIPQQEAQATNAPSIKKESAEIDWRKSAQQIHNRVRAMIPWPVAHTFYKKQQLRILKSELNVLDLETKRKLPGTIVQIVKNEGFIVATGNGHLLIQAVQPAGKKKMKAYDFVIGHDVKIGEVLPN
jgi:methionyl-tRNA formyltransferase